MLFALAISAIVTIVHPAELPQPGVQEKDSVARVIDRLPLEAAAFSIVNEEREAALLLRESTMVMQLTDRGLNRIDRELKKEQDNASLGSRILAAVVGTSIRTLLDRAIEYSLWDVKRAFVEDGVLVIENKAGKRVFEDVNVNDEKLLATFSERDAKRFAKRVNERVAALAR